MLAENELRGKEFRDKLKMHTHFAAYQFVQYQSVTNIKEDLYMYIKFLNICVYLQIYTHLTIISKKNFSSIVYNPLNTELNPICQ